MKCSKCGYRASDIAHLAAHYRKKHPKSMKRKVGVKKKTSPAAKFVKMTESEKKRMYNMLKGYFGD